jgi:hypothetical protein
MASCKTGMTPLVSMLLQSASTTVTSVPAGPWRQTAGLTGGRVSLVEIRGLDGLLLVCPGIELTNDPRNPPGSQTQIKVSGGDVNGFANANGFFDADTGGVTSLSGAASKALFRPVWLVKLSSGSTRAFAWAYGSIELFYNQS